MQRKYWLWQNAVCCIEFYPTSKCHCCLCLVPHWQRKHTLPLLPSSVFSCICMQQHYCTWALKYNTAEAQKAPIIFPAHVFEAVDGAQLNAKRDPSGLSLDWKQFSLLLTLFHSGKLGKACHCYHKATDFTHAETLWQTWPIARKTFSRFGSSLMFWVFISDWSLRSLISWGRPSVRAH